MGRRSIDYSCIAPEALEEKEEFSENVTLIVKTFERKALIQNFIRTVRERYPNLKILLADGSEIPLHEDE